MARTTWVRAHVKLLTLAVTAGFLAPSLLTPGVANAAVDYPMPSAQVSFTFDDGLLSSFTQAAPVLQNHGLTGTNYVVANCVGMTSLPNSCRANGDAPYMNWQQVTQLQTRYGWEIGSHGLDHQCLASSGDDCQAKRLTPVQVDEQLSRSKSALADHGIAATAFAPPYGDYDQTVMATAAKYYTSMRGFKDEGANRWPFSDYLLTNVPVREGIDTVDTLKSKVDEAIAAKTWVVFTFHDIVDTPSTDPDEYEFGTAELDELAAYVQTRVAAGEISNTNVSQGLASGTENKLPNDTFNSGISEGWRTDDPARITADAGGNGSVPDHARSVKLVSGASPSHLFSPRVPVMPGTEYLYKSFLNVSTLASGEVAFYVDEYDANGDWVSGQYRQRENTRWVEELNFTYTPSSKNVTTASLQVIVDGTGITAYLDNVQMLALGPETSTPLPDNLVANGAFDSAIGAGWSTDDVDAVVADSSGHGAPANPVNSVRLQTTTRRAHLFSPQVDVMPGNYSISAYLDIKKRDAGEVGWYIDEYDANGDWISGQWKLANTALGVTEVDLSYSPSTASVAAASLQVYATGDSEVVAYVDDVRWWRH